MSSRLKEQYQSEIVEALKKKFEYKNIMEVPKLDKIVINMGVGEAKENAKALETAIKDMEIITGQKAVVTRAKNKVRGMDILFVTTAKTDEEARELLAQFNMPFAK